MGKKLYVGNISFSCNEDALRDVFSEVGTVETVTIIKDRDSGRSKGFGFVEMSSDDEAARAIESINGREVMGRALTVSEARPQAPRTGGGGGGGGGGYRGGGGGGYGGGNGGGGRRGGPRQSGGSSW
jgi:RNA recognition motif-containing protein